MRLVFCILFLSTLSCKQKSTWVQPVYAPITEALFASGHIEPVDQFVLTSFSEGYLALSHVKESDLVRAGDVLFALDYETRAIEEQAARENLQIARRSASAQSPVLLKLESDLDAAKRKCVRDSTQYANLTLLVATGSVAQVDVDNMRLQYDTDVSNVKAIRQNIAATRLSLQQALIQAQAQYSTYSAGNRYYNLSASGSARVYQVFKRPGELVRKGEAVALLGSADSLIVVLQVDEAGIAKVKLGQTVLVELNTDKGRVLQASVSRIYPYFDNATQSFKVEAVFTQPLDGVFAGTLLQANIVVAKKERAMLIPRSCLSPDGKVAVKRKRTEQLIPIRTGIVSTEWVEVLNGLTTSDLVLKNL